MLKCDHEVKNNITQNLQLCPIDNEGFDEPSVAVEATPEVSARKIKKTSNVWYGGIAGNLYSTICIENSTGRMKFQYAKFAHTRINEMKLKSLKTLCFDPQ
jgi:hypothetical protein